MTFAARALQFYRGLRFERTLPRGIDLLNPYSDAPVQAYLEAFLFKFFDDERSRVLVLGINPGRLGGGMTGIPFTDPVALESSCGIPNLFKKRRELSSQFIYQFIEDWGGPADFFGRFYLTALCPFGFTRDGANFNFYDDAHLLEALRPLIVETLRAQIAFGSRRDVAIVLGTGKNRRFLEALNQECGFFGRVEALEHPRFIMQYRRKQIAQYVARYRQAFADACGVGLRLRGGGSAPPRSGASERETDESI